MLHIPNPLLKQMFETYTVLDANDQPQEMASNISADNANRLYHAVKTYKPHLVLEIGLAYGISALAILTALQELDHGAKLISIDPFQQQSWGNIGLLNIQRSGLESYHQFIDTPDYLALPHLLTEKNKFDLAYIDGWHIFDYVMMNFFYVDKMLDVGAVVAFNDASHEGVKQTIKFLKGYRRYHEIHIAMPQSNPSDQLGDYQRRLARIRRSGNFGKLFKSLRFRLTNGFSLSDRYFQKSEFWEPSDANYCDIVNEATAEKL